MMVDKGKIFFFSEDIKYILKDKRLIRSWLSRLFILENREIETVNYILCSDKYLYDLNVEYLEHETLTDTISFTYSSDIEPIIGDVFISYERVKENAFTMGIKTKDELLRLLAHGALHLCGYNDKTPGEKTIMTNKEDDYLLLYRQLAK